MDLDSVAPIVFFVIFALIVGSFVVKIIRHGGLKAALFGSSIRRTIGEVPGAGPKLMNVALRVHALGNAPNEAVGVEIVAKSVASYQMMPITLSSNDAAELVKLINEAVDEAAT